MVQWLERGVLLLALATALVALVIAAMFFSTQNQQESRAFADAQYVSAGVETEAEL